MKVWQRYILSHLLKTTLFATLALFVLYCLIDYSVHMKKFSKAAFTSYDTLMYYVCHFSELLLLLIPFCLLISIIRVAIKMSSTHELTALLVSGLTLKKITVPFVLFASAISCLLLINMEYIEPLTTRHLNYLEQKIYKNDDAELKSITLDDQSLLIFEKYDQKTKSLSDVIWIKNLNEIFRIQSLEIQEFPPVGTMVVALERKDHGFEKAFDTPSFTFSLMPLNEQSFEKAIVPIKLQKPSQLFTSIDWSDIKFGFGQMDKREARSVCILLYKILMPFTGFLLTLAIVPFALKPLRESPLSLYSCSIFALLLFFMVFQGGLILGQHQIIVPMLALGLPFILTTLGVTIRYACFK